LRAALVVDAPALARTTFLDIVPFPFVRQTLRADRETRLSLAREVEADVSDPVQVTAGGGSIVGWRGDGRRFYFRVGTTIWELEVGPERVATSPPVAAFTVSAETVSAEVTPDGQRLVVARGGPMYSELVVRQGVLAR
jgi:hypothetical protein